MFSTVISKEDYEDMAAAQAGSMMENPFKKVLVPTEPGKKSVAKKPDGSKQAAAKPVKPVPPKSAPAPKNVNPGFSVPGLGASASIAAEQPAEYGELDLSKLRDGTIVENEKYGRGKVKAFKPRKLRVSYSADLKMFLMPSAFEKGYLKVIEW